MFLLKIVYGKLPDNDAKIQLIYTNYLNLRYIADVYPVPKYLNQVCSVASALRALAYLPLV
jgi:hypothetical protein